MCVSALYGSDTSNKLVHEKAVFVISRRSAEQDVRHSLRRGSDTLTLESSRF